MLVALVWHGFAVHLEAVAVESPEEVWMLLQEVRVGTVHEVELATVHGIVIPEAFLASEVGQTGVASHAGSGTYNDDFGLGDETDGFVDHLL